MPRAAEPAPPHIVCASNARRCWTAWSAASGYVRVDWFTPDGLKTWGDVRLFIQGTEGYIELRKNVDIAGRAGNNHLFLVDSTGVRHLDCSDQPLPFAAHFLADIANRTESAVTQAHTFTVSELALRAQQAAWGV